MNLVITELYIIFHRVVIFSEASIPRSGVFNDHLIRSKDSPTFDRLDLNIYTENIFSHCFLF